MANRLTGGPRLGALLAVLALALTLSAPGAQAAKKSTNSPIGIYNIIQSVSVVNGGLVATTTQGQTLPLTLAAQPAASGTCPVLNLALGPINLNLLGLQVMTSPICLGINAQSGGGLLGNLLCSIANGLNLGTPLSTILGGLTTTDLTTLTSGLTNLLNGVLNNLNQAVITSVQQAAGTCPVLNLSLGPLNLNLLGLVVTLNNCNGGPVTVTINAISGGGLLGNLLCSLSNTNILQTFVGQTLQQFLQYLLGLV